jgi:drug/metabolite transporter (DMT)-like permease
MAAGRVGTGENAAVTDTATSARRGGFAPLDWGLLLGAAGIWGASFLFTAEALEAFEPGLVTLCRVGFGLLTLSLVPGSRRPVDPSDHNRIRLLGLTWMAFPLTLFPLAQQWIDSSLTGMLNSAMPLLTVIVTALLFHGPVRRPQVVGVGVGLVGILMMGLPTASAGDTNALGVLLVVTAVGSYGIAVNLAGPLQQKYGALPVLVRALRFAFVLVLPFGLFGLSGSSFQASSLLACVALGAGGTGIAFVLSANLAGRQGPIASAIVTYLMPVVSVALGVALRDETVSAWELGGCAVVLVGAWVASLGSRPAQIRVSGRT